MAKLAQHRSVRPSARACLNYAIVHSLMHSFTNEFLYSFAAFSVAVVLMPSFSSTFKSKYIASMSSLAEFLKCVDPVSSTKEGDFFEHVRKAFKLQGVRISLAIQMYSHKCVVFY